MKTSVGLEQNSLPEKTKNEIGEQKTKQERIKKAVKNIQDDILGFFSRTRIKKYQDVSDEMEKEKIQNKLEETVGAIAKNQTAKGISSTREIAAKLEKWAKDLGQKRRTRRTRSFAALRMTLGSGSPLRPERPPAYVPENARMSAPMALRRWACAALVAGRSAVAAGGS